jgi:hypothetical protein
MARTHAGRTVRKRRRRMGRPVIATFWLAAAAFGLALATSGCNDLIGLTGYTTRADASIPQEVVGLPADGDAAFAEASCDAGSLGPCDACPPVTNQQFLNACTSATCVPFDDIDRLTNLLPDGSLPPLPPIQADDSGDED